MLQIDGLFLVGSRIRHVFPSHTKTERVTDGYFVLQIMSSLNRLQRHPTRSEESKS